MNYLGLSLKFISTIKVFDLMPKFKIQNKIRELRFFANEMTQEELAQKVEVSRQTIIAIEKGNYSPSLELAFKIAKVFKVTLEEVFSYVPDS